jgi:hypothetical protein
VLGIGSFFFAIISFPKGAFIEVFDDFVRGILFKWKKMYSYHIIKIFM